MARSFSAALKVDAADLAYPNAEMVRKMLVNILPAESIILVPHDHFGMDLGPGLSIKLNAAYLADVVAIIASLDPVMGEVDR